MNMNLLLACCFLWMISSCGEKQDYNLKITWIEFPILSNGGVSPKGDTIAFEYQNNQNLILKKITKEKTELGLVEMTSYYDLNGKWKGSIVNYGNRHIYQTDIVRNKAGYIVEMKMFEVGDTDTSTTFYVYSFSQDSSLVLSKAISKVDSTIVEIYEEKYDKEKRLIQMTTKTPSVNGEVTEFVESYEYNTRGNKISYQKQNLIDNITLKQVFIYDDSNNLVKEIHMKNNVMLSQMDFKYDGKKKKEAIKKDSTLKNKSKIQFIYSVE